MVLLYLKLLAYTHISAASAMALAAGSTIAGNMLVLGAASNVIIIQGAERRRSETLSFTDFARIGIILTALNVIVYWVFLGA
jgi:Na+/H+ antiporter NhaD/arsenite permease-like protein